MNLFGLNISKAKREAGGNNRLLSAMLQWFGSGREWIKNTDDAALLNAYRSWVYVCVQKNSQAVASIPFKIFVASKAKGKSYRTMTRAVSTKDQNRLFKNLNGFPVVRKAQEFQEVLEHPAFDLLSKVNKFMNKTYLLSYQDMHCELTGNAYWYVLQNGFGTPQEIWPVIPDRMTVIPDAEKFIRGYVYTNGTVKREYTTNEIIHFKWPNPNNLYYGTGPLGAAADMYNINQNMNTYENAMFSNNARPDGYFSTEEELDKPEYDRLQAELLATWGGIGNSGKTGLMTNGVKFNPITLPPKEMGFLNGREHTKSEIFNIFGVPMGLMDEKANRANAEAAQYVYAKYTIHPRIKMLEEKLNETLLPMFDENIFIVFDDVVNEDQEYQLKEDTELRKIGARSNNEIRLSRNQEPVEGGDSYEPLSGGAGFAGDAGATEGKDKEIINGLVSEISDSIAGKLTL